MSNGQNDKKRYSSEDISRYVNGEMTPQEMHALEKEALDDPFLSDAMEGLAQRSGTIRQELADVKSRFAKRIEKKGRRFAFPISRIGVAAMVFLIAGSLAVVYFLNTTGSREVLVQNKQMPAATQQTRPNEQADSTVVRAAPSPSMTLKNERVISGTKSKEVKDERAGEAPLEKQKAKGNTESPALEKPLKTFSTNNADELKAQRDTALAFEQTAPILSKPAAAAAKSKSFGNVAQARPTISLLSPTQEQFIPAQGWKNYNDYLVANKTIVVDVQNVHGDVNLEFTIRADGTPANVKVIKSFNPALDHEAVRLITEGPKWSIVSGDDRTARVMIMF